LARLPTNLVVKTHRPGRYRLLVVGLLLALLASSYGLFEFGRIRGGYDFLESREQISQRDREIAQLNRKIEQLRDQVVLLETSSGIDEEAHQQIEQRLQVLQGTIQNQAEGLAFYKGIISPEDGEAGLKIRNFTVEPGTEPGWYLVKIVLIQAKDHGRQVSGVVDLSIDGQLAGEAKTLALADLRQTAGVTGGPAFSFRYFQELEESLSLPEGFVPEKINIEVRPKGRSARTIRKSFDWQLPPDGSNEQS
jgi:cell division protein FtsB